jgi:hypothetical protein
MSAHDTLGLAKGQGIVYDFVALVSAKFACEA